MPERPEDKAMVDAALRGDLAAMDAFVARMRCVPRMLAAKNAEFGSPLSAADLEDLAQDTILVIWRKLAAYDGSCLLETWTFRFCFLELLKRLRGRRRGSGAIGAQFADQPAATDRAVLPFEEVHLGLEQLPGEEADIVRLKHFEDLTFADIGVRLGLSANTAKTRYYRAIRKLRALLREITPPELPWRMP